MDSAFEDWEGKLGVMWKGNGALEGRPEGEPHYEGRVKGLGGGG